MSLSDPLGDMLTRIRNAQIRKKDYVQMPASRFRGNVLEVLEREGFIRGFKKIELENHKKNFEIELKYIDGEPVIKEISRISTPGRRVYSNIKDLQRNFPTNPIFKCLAGYNCNFSTHKSGDYIKHYETVHLHQKVDPMAICSYNCCPHSSNLQCQF